MSDPGDIRVDYGLQSLEFDDGVKRRTVATGPNVDVRDWGARPGENDMTSELQKAAASAPEGCTLVFPSGQYNISDTVWFHRDCNVLANGAILHLGTSVPTTVLPCTGFPENHDGDETGGAETNYLSVADRELGALTTKAAVIWGRREGSDRPGTRFFKGMKIQRTPTGDATAASKLFAGFVAIGIFHCTVEDLEIWNFREALVLTNDRAEGCVMNRIIRPHTFESRYHITLIAQDSGWTNDNHLDGGRALTSSSISGHISYVPQQWEIVRILYSSTTTHAPNNNTFDSYLMETACGRKARIEGQYNTFTSCRYETTSGGDRDITIGNDARVNGTFANNQFIWGYQLQNVMNADRIEYLASSFDGINVNQTFMGADHWMLFCDTGDAKVNIGGTNHDTKLISLMDRSFAATAPAAGSRLEKMGMYAELPAGVSADKEAGFVFYDVNGTQRNWLAMHGSSPWPIYVGADLHVLNDLSVDGAFSIAALGLPLDIGGLVNLSDVSGDLEFYIDGVAARCVFRAASTDRSFDFYNSSSSNNDVIRFLNASKEVTWGWKATSTGLSSGHYGAMEMYETATNTLVNGIMLSSTAPYPVNFERGIYVNRVGGDYDTRFRTPGSLNTLFIDAGEDRVGIGTAVPGSLLHVAGATQIDTTLTVEGKTTLASTNLEIVDYLTTHVEITSPTTNARVYFKAQSTNRTFDLYNTTASGNDVLRILDASRYTKMVFKASDTTFTGTQWGIIVFYEASTPGSETESNAIYLTDQSLGGGTKSYAIGIQKSLWVNRSAGDYDFRVSGDTESFLLVTDASTDRVGIGQSTPQARLEVETETDEATAALLLDQNDTDQPLIKFEGQISANSVDTISSWTAGNTIQGFIQVNIGGTKRWIPYYDNPTS